MNQKYTDCVEQISQILFQAITEREENLVGTIEQLDCELLSLLRTIGLRVMSMLMTWLVNQVTNQAKTKGWVIHRRPLIKYTVIFGPLLELDGCHLRTGVKVPEPKVGLTKIRQLPKSARKIEWREARVAFARPVEHQKQRTFVAKMGKYSEVMEQLVGAAYDRGNGSKSQIFALADGAKGLKEALEKAFPRIQFILDRPHLKQHLYQAVEAMNLKKKLKHSKVDALVSLIDGGQVQQVITTLRNYQGTGVKEIENLANYLDRFHNCVHYRKFQQLGLPIGSGEIESAHRYIPQKRLKIPGATWHPNTINPLLALRILRANDWWSDFWSESRLRLSA